MVRITGAAQHEAPGGTKPGGLDEQLLQLGLTILRVGTQIRKVGPRPPRLARHRLVRQRIDVSIQGYDAACSQQVLHGLQGRAACIAEYQIEPTQCGRGQVVNSLAGIQPGQRNRRVQVIEYVYCRRGLIEAKMRGGVGIWAVRCHDRGVRAGNMTPGYGRDRRPVAVKHELRARKGNEITVRGVVGDVFLEKDGLVAARAERGEQAAPQRGMTVSPGGAQCKAKDDDLHASW